MLAISVLYDGVLVPSSRPPRIVAETAMVPLRPYVTRLSSRIKVNDAAGTIWVERAGRSITLRIGSLQAHAGDRTVALRAAPFLVDDTVYVPLAAVARALGVAVDYAAQTASVMLDSPDGAPLATMSPFDPAAPSAAPTRIFTPEPVRTQRPVLTQTPHPRRTPIPVIPSRP